MKIRTLWIIFILVFIVMFVSSRHSHAGVYSYVIGQNTGQSNAAYEERQKALEEGRITCIPQKPETNNLWTCKDAYDNEYKDMVITLKSEIERLHGIKKSK